MGEERKESGGEKAKGKSRDGCVNFKPKNHLEILLSVHGRTSEADILNGFLGSLGFYSQTLTRKRID